MEPKARIKYFGMVSVLVVAITAAFTGAATAKSILDEFAAIISKKHTPVDDLFFSLGLVHVECFARSQYDKALNSQLSTDCNSSTGDEAISRFKENVRNPQAQASLKELIIYWRTELATMGLKDHEEEVAVLHRMKNMAERIRAQNEVQ